jgi:hypothetical protein
MEYKIGGNSKRNDRGKIVGEMKGEQGIKERKKERKTRGGENGGYGILKRIGGRRGRGERKAMEKIDQGRKEKR